MSCPNLINDWFKLRPLLRYLMRTSILIDRRDSRAILHISRDISLFECRRDYLEERGDPRRKIIYSEFMDQFAEIYAFPRAAAQIAQENK